MAGIRRIVFTGDILRPFPRPQGGWESATVKNVRWLRNLVGWQVQRATELPVETVTWEPGGFDTPALYSDLALDLGPDAWASIFYADSLPPPAEDRLAAPFEGALVIGVEIPDILQHVLARRGIPFVDLVAHPIRFMDDILFAFRTSIPGVHDELLRRRFDTDRCSAWANLHRAKVAWMPQIDLPEGTALITGQVATDKAVICRRSGRFLSLADYAEDLFDICERHPRVLFKPHPYQGAGCPSMKVTRSFGAIRIVDENFYYLMGHDAITDVYSISSGTVWEAPWFGKEGHAFAEPLYDFSSRPPRAGRAGAAVPVSGDYLAPLFWADLLEPVVTVRKALPAGPEARPSRLRRSLNADWDHAYIDAVVQTPRNLAALTERAEPVRR